MTPLEVTLAWIIGISTAIGALGVIGAFLVRLWRSIGRADAILTALKGLPERLAAIDKRMADHLIDSERKSEHLEAIDRRLGTLDLQLRPVVYQLKPNGGGSAVDRLARLEEGIAGLYAQPGEPGSPGRITGPVPVPPTED